MCVSGVTNTAVLLTLEGWCPSIVDMHPDPFDFIEDVQGFEASFFEDPRKKGS
jgi:hypothetical protein